MLPTNQGRIVLQNDNFYYMGYKLYSCDKDHFKVDEQRTVGFVAPGSQKIVDYERTDNFDPSAEFVISFMPGFYNENAKAIQKIPLRFGEVNFHLFNDEVEIDREERDRRLAEIATEYEKKMNSGDGKINATPESEYHSSECDCVDENFRRLLRTYRGSSLSPTSEHFSVTRVQERYMRFGRSTSSFRNRRRFDMFDRILLIFTVVISVAYFLYVSFVLD